MNTAYLSIGSNIDKEINIPACLHRLHREFEVRKISSVYATEPVGPPGQNPFWNAAAEIRTDLSFPLLRDKLKQLEDDFGRIRNQMDKYKSRPLDLDVILYNDQAMEEGGITLLPSPQLEQFAFVLIPMAEIAPQRIHPKLGITLSAMASDFHDPSQQWSRLPAESLQGAAETAEMRSKVALITGGGVRVGKDIASYLAAKGYAVAVHYHSSEEEARTLVEHIRSQGGAAMCLQGDLADPGAPERLVRQVIDRWGYLDFLINNASVFYATPTSEMTPEVWRDIFAVNLRAPHFLAKHAASHLGKQRGAIVNIADIYAERPLASHSAYSASKAGLVALTKSLAQELAPQIRVNAVEPGAILFPEGYDEAKKQALLSKIPLGVSGSGMQIAETVYFLCDGPSYLSGTVINVDGGRLAVP